MITREGTRLYQEKVQGKKSSRKIRRDERKEWKRGKETTADRKRVPGREKFHERR